MSEKQNNKQSIKKTSWYGKTVAGCFDTLTTRSDGLGQDEVEQRQQRFGKNKLPDKKIDSVITVFLGQFKDLLIYILPVPALAVRAAAELYRKVRIRQTHGLI